MWAPPSCRTTHSSNRQLQSQLAQAAAFAQASLSVLRLLELTEAEALSKKNAAAKATLMATDVEKKKLEQLGAERTMEPPPPLPDREVRVAAVAEAAQPSSG